MKKIAFLFLLVAMLGGCENPDKEMYAPTEASGAAEEQLAVQNAAAQSEGVTITCQLRGLSSNYDATLTITYDDVMNVFNENIVCYMGAGGETSTPVNRSFSELGGLPPMAAKLEVRIFSAEPVINATVSFRSRSTIEMQVPLTLQGDTYVAQFGYGSEFNENIRLMFSQMNEQMNECFIQVKTGDAPANPKIVNRLTGSWSNTTHEAAFNLEYPATSTVYFEYIMVNAMVGFKLYPQDGSVLTMRIPSGATSAKAYLPGFNEPEQPVMAMPLNISPASDDTYEYKSWM